MLGESKSVTIKSNGCFLVSLANLIGVSPLDLNKELIKYSPDCFVSSEGTMINAPKVAEYLGMKYERTTKPKGKTLCVCETHDTKAPQHFFLYNAESDSMLDPMHYLKNWEKRTYKIVSYRYFTPNFSTSDTKIFERALTKLSDNYEKAPEYRKKLLHTIAEGMRELLLFPQK
jgi:hypothetical protein